ncbi:glycosyltransferase family 2 protein [uncultured Roseivirga sp.]|uniref:glycosyltransferase family 2 protein n=1 Tax=uncultured Roseivirga sp. TaxID=543088 RepID=UPI0030DD2C2C|tara:strand:+ start:4438 stop:5361 length:924 start_codon:yes stop_codon:yes gene_type:complete
MSQSDLASSPSLAIIIVNWNSFNVTKNCLESLRQLEYSNFEVIVVDNGSNDDSLVLLKSSFPEVTVLENGENLGFTGGNNTGIKYALDSEKDLIMLLNNDTIVTPDFAMILVETLLNDNTLGAVQPKIMYNQEKDVIWNAGGFFNSFFSLSKTRGLDQKDEGQYDKPIDVDWITGCCFLVKSSVVKQIGLLDDKFFIYYEDSDWSFKIKKLGYRLRFEPKSKIYHEVGMSNQNRKDHNEGNVSPFTHYMVVRNHLFMVRRYAKGINKIGSWGNQVLKISGYIGYFILRRRFVKLKFVIKGLRDGLTK